MHKKRGERAIEFIGASGMEIKYTGQKGNTLILLQELERIVEDNKGEGGVIRLGTNDDFVARYMKEKYPDIIEVVSL